MKASYPPNGMIQTVSRESARKQQLNLCMLYMKVFIFKLQAISSIKTWPNVVMKLVFSNQPIIVYVECICILLRNCYKLPY